jgi:CRP-like cAMP-binding protein
VFKETRKDKIKFSFLLYKLARRIEYQFIRKGETIFRIGEKGEKFYLILKGNIHILKLVQTAKEMRSEDYLILLHKLKKERDF